MQISIAENRTIITFDIDYTDLIFRHGYKPESGVVYLRINDYTPDSLSYFLLDLFSRQDIDFQKKISVIKIDGIRQRSYI
jgi:predicted nuclease of predicted toxin-antitoxin system